MKQKIILLFYSMSIFAVVLFSSCNNNGRTATLTHDDSLAIANAVMTGATQKNASAGQGYTDTIPLPQELTKSGKFVNGNMYTYILPLNALVQTDAAKERGFNLTKRNDAPVDTVTLNQYVRNYKTWANNGATTYMKQYCYLIQKSDIVDLFNVAGCVGIRVYMGIQDSTRPDSQTVIITGYNQYGGDVYLAGLTPNSASAIDQASPCPTDCPYKYSDGMDIQDRPKPNKMMLGRIKGKDPQ